MQGNPGYCNFCGHASCPYDSAHSNAWCDECHMKEQIEVRQRRLQEVQAHYLQDTDFMEYFSQWFRGEAPSVKNKPAPSERTAPNVPAPNVPRVERRGL